MTLEKMFVLSGMSGTAMLGVMDISQYKDLPITVLLTGIVMAVLYYLGWQMRADFRDLTRSNQEVRDKLTDLIQKISNNPCLMYRHDNKEHKHE